MADYPANGRPLRSPSFRWRQPQAGTGTALSDAKCARPRRPGGFVRQGNPADLSGMGAGRLPTLMVLI